MLATVICFLCFGLLFSTTEHEWKVNCVKHGAAVYITKNGEPVWTWKDDVEVPESDRPPETAE